MAKSPKTAHEGIATLPTELQYGNTVLPLADIPEVSKIALMARGLSHILGNEVASKVSGKVKKWEGENEALFADDPDSFDEASKENREAWAQEAYDEAVAKIMSGTLGLRAVGPRGTAIETEMRDIAIDEIKAHLAKQNVKWPAKADGIIQTKTGPMTRSDLVAAFVAKHADRLRAEAERRQAAVADVAGEIDL